MHELSVAASICESVADRVGPARVDEMIVQVGSLSGVNPEALEFALPHAAQMTGVRLDRFTVELVSARAVCECGHTYEAKDLIEPCPRCGGFRRTFSGGDDIVVSRLVVVLENDETH